MSLVNSYDPHLLNEKDLLRESHRRSAKAEGEWKTSRALLQRLPGGDGTRSLTHKSGHAAVALAPAGWEVGIDLECIRARQVSRLAGWMASEDEAVALAALPSESALRHFYRLWTFKEAMIKARGQDFPADLRANTLQHDVASGQWRIETTGRQGWSLRLYEAAPGWVLSVVWRAPAGERADVAWHIASDAPASPFTLSVACEG